MVDYTPATSVQQSVYGMLASGTAFDKTPVDYATMIQTSLANLGTILTALNGAANVPQELGTTTTVTLNLIAHLNDHYDNLVDNAALVSSGISDAIGFGVIGTAGAPRGALNNPVASYPDFFGSIMGKSNAYVAQIANQITAMSIYAAALLAGAMISTLSSSQNTSIQTALGTLATPTVLVQTLETLTFDGIALLGTTMQNLAALSTGTNALSLADETEIHQVMLALGIISPVTP